MARRVGGLLRGQGSRTAPRALGGTTFWCGTSTPFSNNQEKNSTLPPRVWEGANKIDREKKRYEAGFTARPKILKKKVSHSSKSHGQPVAGKKERSKVRSFGKRSGNSKSSLPAGEEEKGTSVKGGMAIATGSREMDGFQRMQRGGGGETGAGNTHLQRPEVEKECGAVKPGLSQSCREYRTLSKLPRNRKVRGDPPKAHANGIKAFTGKKL